MLTLPKRIIQVLRCFEEAFSERVWQWAQVLLIGAILAPGERTVTAILRVMGQSREQQFQNYHRVLNRARWSSRALSRILLHLLVRMFVPEGAPIVVGIDETIERRRGAKIAAKGIYRDPVRSSKEFFVKTSGLRWVSMMVLAPIPWAERIWALPFFSVLAPSERYYEQRGRRHKKMTDWGRQMIRQLRRWLPDRYLVVVADSSYAVLELLACAAGLGEPVTVITRLRLDAALYDPTPVRKPGTNGRPRKKGALHQGQDHLGWQSPLPQSPPLVASYCTSFHQRDSPAPQPSSLPFSSTRLFPDGSQTLPHSLPTLAPDLPHQKTKRHALAAPFFSWDQIHEVGAF